MLEMTLSEYSLNVSDLTHSFIIISHILSNTKSQSLRIYSAVKLLIILDKNQEFIHMNRQLCIQLEDGWEKQLSSQTRFRLNICATYMDAELTHVLDIYHNQILMGNLSYGEIRKLARNLSCEVNDE